MAWRLFERYRSLGHDSWLAVGLKRSEDPDVLLIQHSRRKNPWSRLCTGAATELQPWVGRIKGAGRVHHLLENLSQPLHWLRQELGHEDFDFAGAWQLLDLPSQRPEIVHCHNLHGPFIPGGGYFDLRALAWLSRQVPVVLTLHDAWLLSGHCAHSFDCERWKKGCGHCPDLTIYPAIRRDGTAFNWRRKKNIFARSRLFVSTPSQWLMRKVEHSILAPAVVEARVIPYGVDRSIFYPADREKARAALGIPQNARVFLSTANWIQCNPWKDYNTLRTAVAQLAERLNGQTVLLMALGEEAPAQRIGQAEVRFVPYQKDPKIVARYYQAADVYVHPARADTFPNAVLEALACGTPVVATAVGGIPEQVKGLETADRRLRLAPLNRYGLEEATGVLAPQGDANGMAAGIERLLVDDPLRARIGENAARDAKNRFDLQRQVDDFLNWYQALLHNAAPHQEVRAVAS